MSRNAHTCRRRHAQAYAKMQICRSDGRPDDQLTPTFFFLDRSHGLTAQKDSVRRLVCESLSPFLGLISSSRPASYDAVYGLVDYRKGRGAASAEVQHDTTWYGLNNPVGNPKSDEDKAGAQQRTCSCFGRLVATQRRYSGRAQSSLSAQWQRKEPAAQDRGTCTPWPTILVRRSPDFFGIAASIVRYSTRYPLLPLSPTFYSIARDITNCLSAWLGRHARHGLRHAHSRGNGALASASTRPKSLSSPIDACRACRGRPCACAWY